MAIYEQITKRRKIYINQDGQEVEPPRKGGGGGSITSVGKVVKFTDTEEDRQREQAQNLQSSDIRVDDEAKQALEVLKRKGLI